MIMSAVGGSGNDNNNNNNDDMMEIEESDKTSVLTLDKNVEYILKNNFDIVSKTCFITCIKLLDNIIQKPNNEVYRTIKLTNEAIDKKIVKCNGGIEFLLSCGFIRDNNNNSQLLILEDINLNTSTLITARRLLMTRCIQELGCTANELPKYKPPPPVVPVAQNEQEAASTTNIANTFNPYQGMRYDAKSAAAGTNLGPSKNYKSKTETEIQRLQEQQEKLQKKLHKKDEITKNREWKAYNKNDIIPINNNNNNIDNNTNISSDSKLLAGYAKKQADNIYQREHGGFTTKTMRNLEKLKKQKIYSYTILQIHFHNGIKLLGKFLPYETIQIVKQSIQKDCFIIDNNIDFDLYVTPPKRILTYTSTLEQEGLVPAAKIFITWKNNNIPKIENYIKSDLFITNTDSTTTTTTMLFPESVPIYDDNKAEKQDDDSKKAATTTNDNNSSKKSSKDREQDLLRRMMGQGPSLGSSNKKKKDNNTNNINNKPKWFKG